MQNLKHVHWYFTKRAPRFKRENYAVWRADKHTRQYKKKTSLRGWQFLCALILSQPIKTLRPIFFFWFFSRKPKREKGVKARPLLQKNSAIFEAHPSRPTRQRASVHSKTVAMFSLPKETTAECGAMGSVPKFACVCQRLDPSKPNFETGASGAESRFKGNIFVLFLLLFL